LILSCVCLLRLTEMPASLSKNMGPPAKRQKVDAKEAAARKRAVEIAARGDRRVPAFRRMASSEA